MHQSHRLTDKNLLKLLLSIIVMSGIGLIQQLFFPIRPALPELPLNLPPSASSLELNLAPHKSKKSLVSLDREYLAGTSQHYLSDNGQYIILTPISSWMLTSIDPLVISSELSPKQYLSNAKTLTITLNELQISTGMISRKPAYQGCLKPDAKVAILPEHLVATNPGIREKTLNTLLPSSLYSFSCILITTSHRGLLDGSKLSKEFLEELNNSIVWAQ